MAQPLEQAEPAAPSEPGTPAEAAPDALPPAGQPEPPQLPAYRATALPPGDPERFYERQSADLLRAQLAQVIAQEGPVAREIAFRRVSRAWGLARLGTRIEKHLDSLLPPEISVTREGGTFFWPEGVTPSGWEGFRVGGSDADSRRAWDEVSLEELGNLGLYALHQQGSVSQAGLVRTVCRLLGIGRVSAELEQRVVQALGHGRVAPLIRMDGGQIFLCTRTEANT
jgi:hypothetical protein